MILVGFVNCSVTLGRFDVQFSLSTMGSCNSVLRKGHVGDMILIVGDLKHQIYLWIISDTIFLEYQGEADLDLN